MLRWPHPQVSFKMILLPPANEVCEGYVFTSVCLSTGGGGVRGGGGQGDMHGGGGACVVGETATAAGGTHPTGMHSCIVSKFRIGKYIVIVGKMSLMASLHCRTRIQVPIHIPNLMATLYNAEHVHIAM